MIRFTDRQLLVFFISTLIPSIWLVGGVIAPIAIALGVALNARCVTTSDITTRREQRREIAIITASIAVGWMAGSLGVLPVSVSALLIVALWIPISRAALGLRDTLRYRLSVLRE